MILSGVHTKRFAEEHGIGMRTVGLLLERILELQNNLEPIVATYHCALALVDPTENEFYNRGYCCWTDCDGPFVTKM